jgi:hypothetical protein
MYHGEQIVFVNLNKARLSIGKYKKVDNVILIFQVYS